MTADEFNQKYQDFLEEKHYGCALGSPEAIDYLDGKFQEFVKRPGFKYLQIKLKFGMARFYAEGISQEEMYEVEREINKIYNSSND